MGVVRPWSHANIINHQQAAHINSSSYLNTMMMMNDLCELPLDQLLKVKKSLHELQLSYSPDAAEYSQKGNAAFENIEKSQSRSIDDDNHGYNKVNYDSNSIATNAYTNQHQPEMNRFELHKKFKIPQVWQNVQVAS